jgi:hypothetical protein
MLQITLEPQGRLDSSKSFHRNNWDFKVRVVSQGDSAELILSFEDYDENTRNNYLSNSSNEHLNSEENGYS